MPVSHAEYCAAHGALHELEDVRRLAEDDRQQLSYDALLCIFSKKQQDLVKRTAGRHRQSAARCAPSAATCAACSHLELHRSCRPCRPCVCAVRVVCAVRRVRGVHLHVPAAPLRLLARCASYTRCALCVLRASYVERYRRGESLEAIANAVQLPPTMLARMVLEEIWHLKKGKEVMLSLTPTLTATATATATATTTPTLTLTPTRSASSSRSRTA
jgi:hypothetical protein